MSKLPNDPEYAKRWPSVWYGPDGQVQQFNSPLEVPEGWYSHPSKVGSGEEPEIPFYDEAVAAAELDLTGVEEDDNGNEEGQEGQEGSVVGGEERPEDSVNSDLSGAQGQDLSPEKLAPVDDMTKEDIVGRLNSIVDLKGQWQPNWSKQRLYDVLLEHLDEAGNQL